MKPFQGPQELEHYKRKLGFTNAIANFSAKNLDFLEEKVARLGDVRYSSTNYNKV